MKYEFEGKASGDCECFCWAVDHETFVRVTGREPSRPDMSMFEELGSYALYPDDFLQGFRRDKKLLVTIEIEEIADESV